MPTYHPASFKTIYVQSGGLTFFYFNVLRDSFSLFTKSKKQLMIMFSIVQGIRIFMFYVFYDASVSGGFKKFNYEFLIVHTDTEPAGA